jgi:hypothetical protein
MCCLGGHLSDWCCYLGCPHQLDSLWETDMDPSKGKVDHTLAVPAATIDPIY